MSNPTFTHDLFPPPPNTEPIAALDDPGPDLPRVAVARSGKIVSLAAQVDHDGFLALLDAARTHGGGWAQGAGFVFEHDEDAEAFAALVGHAV